jgi:hypothetical protein
MSTASENKDAVVREGIDFIKLVLAQEQACEKESSAPQSALGERALNAWRLLAPRFAYVSIRSFQ